MALLDVALGLYSQDRQRSEARKNRSFQAEMSNTAYQRAAADLEAAGLNRILALGSPATTPGGSVAQISNLGGLVSNSQQAAAAMEQGAAATTQAETGAKAQAVTEKQVDATIKKIEQEIGKMDAETKLILEKTRTIRTVANIVEQVGTDVNAVLQAFRDSRDQLGRAIADDIASFEGYEKANELYKMFDKWIPNFENSPAGMLLKSLMKEKKPAVEYLGPVK